MNAAIKLLEERLVSITNMSNDRSKLQKDNEEIQEEIAKTIKELKAERLIIQEAIDILMEKYK